MNNSVETSIDFGGVRFGYEQIKRPPSEEAENEEAPLVNNVQRSLRHSGESELRHVHYTTSIYL